MMYIEYYSLKIFKLLEVFFKLKSSFLLSTPLCVSQVFIEVVLSFVN